MLPNPLTERMIEELTWLVSELKDGQRPSNIVLDELLRTHFHRQMAREAADAE